MIFGIDYSMQTETKQSILTLENQSRITMTGVERVDTFSERMILLTVNGKRVRIEGSKLRVLAFSEGSGNFSASGTVDAIRYMAGGGRVGRLFG